MSKLNNTQLPDTLSSKTIDNTNAINTNLTQLSISGGTGGQVLSTNGSGTLNWITASANPTNGDKGDITVSGSGSTWTIDNDAVTYGKIQNVSTNNRLLGRASSGAGDIQEITLGTGLSLSGTTLNVSSTGGSQMLVTTFTSSGTFNKQTWTKFIHIAVIGAGGGGGSGRRGDITTNRGGGGAGGSGGAVFLENISVSNITFPVTITVGAGGIGGLAVTTNDTNGNNGTSGGQSSFISSGSERDGFYRSSWGYGGFGGSTSTASGGTSQPYAAFPTFNNAGAHGSSGGAGNLANGSNGTNGIYNSGGGGGAGQSANTIWDTNGGSSGQLAITDYSGSATPRGNVGWRIPYKFTTCGSGGGGGDYRSGQSGQSGRNGGLYGGGGGGGSASDNGFQSGAGGNGSNGIVVIVEIG